MTVASRFAGSTTSTPSTSSRAARFAASAIHLGSSSPGCTAGIPESGSRRIAVGASLTRNDKLGEIESVKAVSDLFAPVSGEVLEVNQEAVDGPEAVNEEPYGNGWLIKVRLSDSSEFDALLTNEAYDEIIVREMEENTD